MIRIVLADDHDLMRRGIRGLLESEPDLEVCGEAANGREAVELTSRLHPDVIVLDLGMPELNGLDALKLIHKEMPATEVLVFSMHDSEGLVREVFAAGARGYVLKSDAARYLVDAIRSLSQHKPFFTERISEAILSSLVSAASQSAKQSIDEDPLTIREHEILQLLAENKNNRDIADTLGISVRTVETHRRSIMQKLNATSIVELVHYAVRNRIVDTRPLDRMTGLAG
jgi:Response regulator containing a CheY-like receiver domain and an HTH DNA-binding domain